MKQEPVHIFNDTHFECETSLKLILETTLNVIRIFQCQGVP